MSEQKCPECGVPERERSDTLIAFECGALQLISQPENHTHPVQCLRNQLAQRDARIVELEGRYEKAVQALWMGPDSLASDVIRDYEENYSRWPGPLSAAHESGKDGE